MTIRRGGSRFPSRGARRTTDWGLGPESIDGASTASSTNLWSGGTTPSANLTLVRTRGWIHYFITSATATGDGFFGASGIYMMTENAFSIGATAALDPLTDANSDMWIWHSFFDVRAVTGTFSDGVNAGVCHVRQEIDSKAMRKDFDPERVMVGVTQVVEAGASGIEFHAQTRQLFKQG